jgi:hypothetical protein
MSGRRRRVFPFGVAARRGSLEEKSSKNFKIISIKAFIIFSFLSPHFQPQLMSVLKKSVCQSTNYFTRL